MLSEVCSEIKISFKARIEKRSECQCLLNIERINRINKRVVVLPNEANGVE